MMMVMIAGLFGMAMVATMLFGTRRACLMLVVLRPSCDQAFDWLKEVGGGTSGPGAALNMLAISLAVIAILKRPSASTHPLVIAWSAVLMAAMLSLLQSADPSGGARMLFAFLTYAAFALLPFALIDDEKSLREALMALLASSFIPVLWGIIKILTDGASLAGEGRLESTFMHPNIFAFFLLGVLTLIGFILTSAIIVLRPSHRRLLLAYAGILIILLLATKTRSAWVGAALLLMGYAIMVDRRWLLSLLFAPALFLVPGVADRILDLQSGNTNDTYATLNSMAWRQLLWAETGEWLDRNPAGFFGHGLDQFRYYVPFFFSKTNQATPTGAHNAVLQAYFEMGLVGLAAFAALFATVLSVMMKHMARDFSGGLMLFLLTIAHLMIASSDNLLDYLSFQWFFWFLVSTVAVSTRVMSTQAQGLEQANPPHRAFGIGRKAFR
jgi:O-antigen ligase